MKPKMMGEKFNKKERDRIFQEIKDNSNEAGALFDIGYNLCNPYSENIDKNWARHIFELCEEIIHKQADEYGEQGLLFDIASAFFDKDYLGEEKDIQWAMNLYDRIIEKYEKILEGDQWSNMAHKIYRIDENRASKLFIKSIDVENNPYVLMDIGDSLGKKKIKAGEISLAYDDRLLQTKAYKKAFKKSTSVEEFQMLASSVIFKDTGNNVDWAKDIYKKAIGVAIENKDKDGLNKIADSIKDWRYVNDPDWAKKVRSML